MTPQEKLIRAREACAAEWPGDAANYRDSGRDSSIEMRAALRALTDLDKPIPDADEAWRPFLEATHMWLSSNPFDERDREFIAAIKAALPLIPEQCR